MSSDATVHVRFLGSSTGAVRATNQLSGSLSGLSRTANLAARALGVGILAGLAAATKAAVTYDRSLRNLNSIAKLSEAQLGALSKQILALAKVSAKPPTELSDAMYEIVSSGFQANDALKILTVTSKAATAGMTTTTVATKAVTAVLNSYGLGADKAARTADILFSVVEKGVLSFEELAAQIGDVLPVASQLGVPLEELGGAIATVTLGGVNAAETMTQLKGVMVSFLKPSEELGSTIKKLGFESGETMLRQLGLEGAVKRLSTAAKGNATVIADWFPNVRALNGFLAISGKNVQRLTENIDAMAKRGTAAAAFAEVGKSIAVQWDKAKASLIAAAIPLGQLLFPLLRKGADAVADFAMSLEARMPMIRAQFGELAGVVQTTAGALADMGRSREGQTALAGLVSAFAGGKLAGGFQNLGASIRGVHPAVAILTGAFGVLGAAVYADLTATSALEQKLATMVATAVRLKQVTDSLAQAKLTARTASHQLEAAEFALVATQELARKAAERYGGGSRQHREALVAVKLATDLVAQSKLNGARADEHASKLTEEGTEALREHRKALAEARAEAEEAGKKFAAVKSKVPSRGDLHIEALNDYAGKLGEVVRELGGTAKDADEARGAVLGLTAALGRLPDVTEVKIFVRTFNTQTTLEGQRLQLPGRSRGRYATGGFVRRVAETLSLNASPEVVTP